MARIITSTITIYLCQHNLWPPDPTPPLIGQLPLMLACDWLSWTTQPAALRLYLLQLTPNILRDLFMSPPRLLSDGHQEKEKFLSSSPRININ